LTEIKNIVAKKPYACLLRRAATDGGGPNCGNRQRTPRRFFSICGTGCPTTNRGGGSRRTRKLFQLAPKNAVGITFANTDLNKKLLKYAEQNVDAAFTFAQKLSQAKNMQDVAKIQTAFMQTQSNALSEQAKELGVPFSQFSKTAKRK
jgi:hypothetical protein